ncbi:MAG TPA: peptidylprolyl isomerase [Segetibacter sp.]|nr:peptidylprolyl isomerase [Segetibacter sp.]
MKKILLSFAYFLFIAASSFAQNLFTYGKHAVTKDEFVRAFNKNPIVDKSRSKALQEYLNLYINFKLKVQAAYDAGLDKDPTQQYELQNFKKQLADNIINDEANVKALIKEAFDRSQKEIHLQQVFIEVPSNVDTAEAYKKIQQAYKELKEGKKFEAVAELFSNDETTRQSKGELGFITVFSLPYDIENVVYSLKAGSYSAPFKTKAGYHIFKNDGERKSSGSRVVAQILIAMPPNATPQEKSIASGKADSLYKLLQSGADFASLAASASNDLTSGSNGGVLPEFTIGSYEPEFENVAFSMKQKGEISKPFQTSYGFHILKLVEAKTSFSDINDPTALASFQEKVIKDNRLEVSKKELIQKKLSLLKYRPSLVKAEDLYIFTDSALKKNSHTSVKGINDDTPLFSFAKQSIKASDWISFAKNNLNGSVPGDRSLFAELYKKYVDVAADEYYRKYMDVYHSDYAKQVKEFKEANLLFAIMEKKVWGRANTDTTGLLQYYNQHKAKYIWPASADVVIVTCNSDTLVKEMQQKLKNAANDWRQITASKGTGVTADSSRYELSQIAVLSKTTFSPGLITDPVKNQNDGSYTFNYLIKVYNEPDQRSFEDARGLLIGDYQQVLEDKWLVELRKKYPVKVNEALFKSI